MARTTQRRRRSFIDKSSSPSEDGTIVDAPLSDTPPSVDGIVLHDNSVQPGPAQHDGSVHDEITPLGADIIEALQIVGKLEQLGLDRQEISLPKCIVLGQQSTGKSSVIEAISGIKTPRDTGTCTRCPLFIELQPSAEPRDTWHAKISLMRQYDVDIHPRKDCTGIEFQGWIPAVSNRPVPFAETHDPAQLEYLIRCAQRATLSPLENPKSFLDPSFDDRKIHKTLFSPNVVCISVSKPGLPPLSFYDLPGLISFAGIEEEEFTVTLVRRLVTKYIQDPEALVLLTCPLETDVHNSVAAGLATKANVKNRCLGVLTKPDRLPVGESPEHLASILEGRHFAMGHGYFVVKNLNSDQIRQGLTHLDARRLEKDFFSTVKPWSTDLQEYQPRFGTIRLQKYLSTQLGNQVLSKLPNIRRQIEDRLSVVDAELSRIPDIPAHIATRTIDDVVHAFADTVRKELMGEHGSMTWSNIWNGLQESMWNMLLLLKPAMLTTAKLDEGLFSTTLPGRSADDSILIDSDDEKDMSGAPVTPSKKRKQGAQPKHERQSSASAPSPFRTPRKLARKVQQPSNLPSAQSESFTAFRKSFNLDDVTLYVSQNSNNRVPGQINPKVREEMMLSAIEHWPRVINVFFDDLEHRLKERMRFLFEQHFSVWSGSELYTASFNALEGLLDNNLYQQRTTMAAESFDDEREGPHIFHENEFNQEKRATMERYTQARVTARLNMFAKDAAQHYGREFSSVERDKIRKDENKMLLIKEEPYAREIDLVADITTYYMIAARRFHDSITMRIESKFFKQLRSKLRDQLQDELGIHDEVAGPRNAQRLLAESPERLERRNILVAKKKALVQGLQCLGEHFAKFQTRSAAEPGATRDSNYQPPSVLTPPFEGM
ncbi:dynamin family protein [Stagonosporopsis vannaccii]|nr:dynamin family protein [Stagonosporopsis vannaccii]